MGKNYNIIDNNKDGKIQLNEINENKINESEEKTQNIIDIEFSTGETIQEEIKVLTKYPNSMLAACINGKMDIPKRNGHFFFDRNYKDFKLLLFFLKRAKLPKFNDNSEEKNFFREMNFWRIPIKVFANKLLQFDLSYAPTCFNIDKSRMKLTKKNKHHGIVLLNKPLTVISPYVEFNIFIHNPFSNNEKFFFGLVDKNIFMQNHINNSFENCSAPSIFYWDIFKNKIFRSKNNGVHNWIEFEKPCKCFWNNYEIKFGMKYDQQSHSVKLYRNDVELNIEIKNVEPGMVPAIELHMEECKIHLSQNNENQEMFYL